MSKKQKYIVIASIISICFTLIFLQYKSQKDKHDKLFSNGKYALVTVQYVPRDVMYADFYFETDKGVKVSGFEKCGECKDYDLGVMYNPNNPNEYELLTKAKHYNPTWRIVFFFFIYFPIVAFVASRVVLFLIDVYFKLIKK